MYAVVAYISAALFGWLLGSIRYNESFTRPMLAFLAASLWAYSMLVIGLEGCHP